MLASQVLYHLSHSTSPRHSLLLQKQNSSYNGYPSTQSGKYESVSPEDWFMSLKSNWHFIGSSL
jgi:hypothetical protein